MSEQNQSTIQETEAKRSIFKMDFSLPSICILGMLIAAEIVLERLLAFNALTIKINLAFIPVALAGYFFGPIGGAICYGLGDIVGTLVFPTAGGGYNPLFTLTVVLVGFLYGFVLNRPLKWYNIYLAALLSRTVGTLGLNTLWIYLLYIQGKKGYFAFFVTRVPEAIIMFAAECLILVPLFLGGNSWLKHLKKNLGK